jgi:NAD(P)-dependent dehydrogenase (short-subunit alcohol dehydrogenase family)
MMGRLSGRSVIVTGAAQGIGAAYAKAIAAEGGSVTVSDIVAPDATVNAIREAGGQAVGVVCNIIDTEAVARMVGAAEEAFGGVQGLVNNAALFAI